MIFLKVTEGIYRGDRPDPVDDIRTLDKYGIKTIINLDDDPDKSRTEKVACRQHGIKYVSIPMDEITVPSPHLLKKVVSAISAYPKPLFVHCAHGHERTGIVIAAYRALCQGVNVKDAIKEMYDQGFTRWYFWWPRVLRKMIKGRNVK